MTAIHIETPKILVVISLSNEQRVEISCVKYRSVLFRHLPIAFPDLVLLLVEKMMVCATEVKSICSSCESEKEEKDIKKVAL